MNKKRTVQLLSILVFLSGFVALAFAGSGTAARPGQPQAGQQKPANPCNPCSKNKSQNPCAKKAQNPCNPCAKKAQNPCAAKKASEEVYQPAASFGGWAKINEEPILSRAHGGMFVTTYANPTARAAIKANDASFPVGAILVKESHMNSNGKPGEKGTIFAMEKTNNGWLWVTTDPTGHVTAKGDSQQMQMCAQCHAGGKIDSAFLRTK
jgi:hypothetical protein